MDSGVTPNPTESQSGRLGRRFCLARRGSDWSTVEIHTFQEGWVDLDNDTGTQARFAEYTASLASELGHADRVRRFADYCIGLLSAEGRKSVEPLAAVTAPERTAANTNRCCTLWPRRPGPAIPTQGVGRRSGSAGNRRRAG